MRRIRDFSSLDVKALEMVCVWFKIFDFAIYESWELSVKC
jgi:hypothetical protein